MKTFIACFVIPSSLVMCPLSGRTFGPLARLHERRMLLLHLTSFSPFGQFIIFPVGIYASNTIGLILSHVNYFLPLR
jgi:hypothetical protein